MKSRYLHTLIILIFCSCGISEKDIRDQLYAPENSLYQQAEFSEESYAIVYQPSALVAQVEIKESDEPKSAILKEYEQLDYFLLEIQKRGVEKTKEEDFYYSYLLQEDIYQTERGDTIKPSLFQLEPNLWGRQKMRVNIAFPKRSSDRFITISDRHGETVNFLIEKQDIDRTTQLANRL